MAVTTWDTAPDYDAWGFDKSWDCADWVQWHRLLKQKFGKEKAKIAWEYAYAKSGWGSSNLDCRTFNSAFRLYMKEENLDAYQNAGIFAPVLKGYSAVTDIAGGIADFFGGNTIKTVLYIGLGLGVVFAGVKVYQLAKNNG